MNRFKSLAVAVVVLVGFVLVAAPSGAQQKKPVSPHEKVATKIGSNEITVEYGRPYSKDPKSGQVRKIWGTLVPYGAPWRAGADQATTLTTKEPIMIGDAAVPAGSYTLYMVPEEKGPTKLAISKTVGKWGIPVDTKNDLARVDMTKETLPKTVDQFTIELKGGADTGALKMEWENTGYSVAIKAKK
jgi:hypothetical protein